MTEKSATTMALAPRTEQNLAMPVSSMKEIEVIGNCFARSGMFGCKTTEQGILLALSCHMEKQTPLQFKRRYHMIDGELSMRADAMLAEFRLNHGGNHDIIERSADRAAIKLKPAQGKAIEFEFTWEEAQAEPFVWSNKMDKDGNRIPKTNWATKRSRTQMLWARVVSDAVRAVCPEVVAGVYTPEEVADIGPGPQAAQPVPIVPEEISGPVKEQLANESQQDGGSTSVPAGQPAELPDEPATPPDAEEAAEPPAAESTAAPVEPEVVKPDDDTADYTRMPVGNHKGRPWHEFNAEQLKEIIAKGAKHGVAKEYIAEAKKALKNAEDGAK